MKKPTQRYCRDQQRDREMLSVNLREGLPWSQGKSTSRLSHQETLKTASQPLSSGALQSLPVCKGIPPSVNGSQLFYRRVSQTYWPSIHIWSFLNPWWAMGSSFMWKMCLGNCSAAAKLHIPRERTARGASVTIWGPDLWEGYELPFCTP